MGDSRESLALSELDRLLAEPRVPVIAARSPADGMFDDADHYHGVGRSALKFIRLAMLAAGVRDARRILDLPCGHGRVTRFLKAAFPDAQLVACDVDRDGVDFCARTLGARPVYSQPDLARVKLGDAFDLIWVGSLLTHLARPSWDDLFRLLVPALERRGLLVFTTHGRRVASLMRGGRTYGLDAPALASLLQEYDRTGFGYRDYPGADGYGVSVASCAWVIGELGRVDSLRLVSYTEMGWDNHQDVLACQRI